MGEFTLTGLDEAVLERIRSASLEGGIVTLTFTEQPEEAPVARGADQPAGPVESGARRSGRDFPQHWGVPEGAPYSEQRSLWITRNVACDRTLRSRGIDPERPAPVRMSGAAALARLAAL